MPIPHPTLRETETDFVKRAHAAMMTEIPDADTRNVAVFDAWRAARGESEEEKCALEKFPDAEFAVIENIPAFKEHSYPWMPRTADGKPKLDEDGQPIVRNETYDFEAMSSICDNLNHRIADTKDFPPITDKHNPKRGSEESKPRLFGFAGPFGLGMIGNKDPKWGIIAKKEHWFRDKAHLAREYPRRSPEVYLGRPMHDRILDPITALGADTPALDMGIHYSADAQAGEEFADHHAYYSGPAVISRKAHYDAIAAMPGASNVCPPSEVEIHKKKTYAEDSPPAAQPANQPNEGESMLAPEDVNTIVKALMETEQMQYVTSLMMADKAPGVDVINDPQTPADNLAGPAAPPVVPPKEQLTEETAPQVQDNAPAPDGDSDVPAEIEEPPMSDEKKKPEDDNKANYSEREKERDMIAKYSALELKVAQLEAERVNDKKALAGADRKAKLDAYRLQGFDIDVDEEMQRCSLESMNEGQFQDHLDVIVKHYKQFPVNVSLYSPDTPLIEDRHAAKARSAANESNFTETEEFRDEVMKYAQAEQEKPDWVHTPDFYVKCRTEVINRRIAKASEKGATTKVG